MARPFSPISHRGGMNRFYDVVVIGSGIGGLISGALLARAGMTVLLVEQHSTCGGYVSGFRRVGERRAGEPAGGRQSFIFDAASHFYPLLGNPASISGRLLLDLGVTTQWVKMDPVDQFHLPDGSQFAVPADFDTYLAHLKRLFNAEVDALDEFFKLTRRLYLLGILHFFQEKETNWLKQHLGTTVRQALNRYFVSEKLKLLLTADCPHWGSPPCRTSFVFDSMLRHSYFEGNYYPRGGSQRFADDLARQFQCFGGHILTKSLVRRIVLRYGRAAAIEVEMGPLRDRFITTLGAGTIVANADMRQTVFGMVGTDYFPPDYATRLGQLRPSFPCFLMHIGVRDVPDEVLRQIHGYYWKDWDSDQVGGDAFQFKVFVPTLYEPRLAPPGGHVVIVQKVIDLNYDAVSDWQREKRAVEEFVLGRLEQMVPGFRDKIAVCQTASAQTSHRFTLNYKGAMLGWEMSPDQLGSGRPATKSPIDGLYFVGQWTRPGGGITPVIISAMNVAARLTGEHPLRRAVGAFDDVPPAHGLYRATIHESLANRRRPAKVTACKFGSDG